MVGRALTYSEEIAFSYGVIDLQEVKVYIDIDNIMNTMVTNGQKGSDVQLGRRQELRCCSIPLDKNVLTVCKSHNSTFIEMTIKKLKKQRASCRLFGLFWVSGPKTDFVPLLLLLVVYH